MKPLLLAVLLVCGLSASAADAPPAGNGAATSPRLTGLIVWASPADVKPAGVAAAGVDVSRLPLLNTPEVRARLAALLGDRLSGTTMQAIQGIILERYRAVGRPYLDVAFPRQDVTNGALQAVVTEYHLGEVRVAGNQWFSDALIRRRSGLKPGQPIVKPALDRALAQLDSPFLRVTPEFQPGAAPGATDVTLRAVDHFPWSFSAGVDDSGSTSTGLERWTLGAAWGNGFGLGHVLSYQFISNSNFWGHRPTEDGHEPPPGAVGHSGSWEAPLPWGDTLIATASYLQQAPVLGPDLGSLGITVEGGLRYVFQLPSFPPGGAPPGDQTFSVGYDYKRTNNNLSFGGVTVSTGYSVISEFPLQYDVNAADRLGLLQLQNTLVLSPGDMLPDNTNAAFQPSGDARSGVPGARASYVYDRLALTRLLRLGDEVGLVLRFTGQAASATLLPIEQLSLAGIDAVRGYQESSVTASSGVVASAELRGPAFSPGHLLSMTKVHDSAQLHIFYDQGQGWNPVASSAAPANVRTQSVGFGGRYQLASHLSARLEQGWQFARPANENARGAFANFSVTMSW